MIVFRRSSNWPRYLVPATISDRSSARMRLSARKLGTSPSAIRCARPSTIAVLPTPGSPINTGLFLVRQQRALLGTVGRHFFRLRSSQLFTDGRQPQPAFVQDLGGEAFFFTQQSQ